MTQRIGIKLPTYNFKNVETGELYTAYMTIANMLEHIKDPNIQQIIGSPLIVSGTPKPDQGFRDVLQKVKSAHYKSTIDTW